MSNSGYQCIRCIFCWFNIFFWVTGCGILGIGIWLRHFYEHYANFLPQHALTSADSLAIIIGSLTLIFAFLGCCGSWFQNRCILLIYFTSVVCMILVELTSGCLAFTYHEDLRYMVYDELRDGIAHHYNVTSGPNGLAIIWDHLHREFNCCGVQNYTDWFFIDGWPDQKWVPDSCCNPSLSSSINSEEQCGRSGQTHLWYDAGCSQQIYLWFVQRLHIIGVIGLLIAFVQLYGIISSVILFCTLKHNWKSQTYTSYDMA